MTTRSSTASRMTTVRRQSADNVGESSTSLWNPMNSLRKRQADFKGGRGKFAKKQKFPTWSHMFVCLVFKDQDVIPDPADRPALQMAGFGEKKILIPGDSDANAIYCQLMKEFPKLQDAGGFELMRTANKGSKCLDVIDVPPTGCNVNYLKAIVHNARVFIRPLQRDLSLEWEEEVSNYVQTSVMFYILFSQ